VRESVVFEKIARHLGIQFIYAEQPVMSETSGGGAALRAALAALPPDWRASLKQAILMADMEQVKALARQIHGRDQILADGIERLADNLRLDQLYGLIQA
jgi:Amt family ammonium transporter